MQKDLVQMSLEKFNLAVGVVKIGSRETVIVFIIATALVFILYLIGKIIKYYAKKRPHTNEGL